MTITLHHLQLSQSERIVWLLQELRIPYELKIHKRDPTSALAPPAVKQLHPAGTAPVLIDDSPPAGTRSPVVLAETEAIVQYLLEVYGDDGKGQGSRLARKPGDADYADYLHWYAFGNCSLQPAISRAMTLGFLQLDEESNPMYSRFVKRSYSIIQLLEGRLKETGSFVVGNEITAADIMTVFSITTMRGFWPADLTDYPNVLRYLQEISKLKSYGEALEKSDSGLAPMIQARVEQFSFKAFPKAKQ